MHKHIHIHAYIQLHTTRPHTHSLKVNKLEFILQTFGTGNAYTDTYIPLKYKFTNPDNLHSNVCSIENMQPLK